MSKQNGDWPAGWELVTIGDVVVLEVAQGAPSTDFTYIDIGSVNNKTKQIESVKGFAAGSKVPSRAQQHVQVGDILVSMTRPNLNAVAKIPTELDCAICSTGFDVLRPIEIEPDWLFLIVKARPFVDAMMALVQGALYPAVRPTDVRAYEFALPPLAEQRRIVTKIEALQKRSRRAREALTEVGLLLEQFRQSVLAAALCGDLTADWRAAHPNVEPASELLHRIRAERRHCWEQAELAKYEAHSQKPPKSWKERYKEPEPLDDSDLPELPEGWCWIRFANVCSVQGGFAFKSQDYCDDGIPLVRIGDLCDGQVIVNNSSARLPEAFLLEYPEYRLNPGDILIAMSGATTGKMAVYDVHGAALLNQRVGRFMPHSQAVLERTYLQLLVESVVSDIRGRAYGGAQPNISPSEIESTIIPFPSLSEQKEIAVKARIAQLGAVSIKRETAAAYVDIDQLDQSILAKAFCGELVPQDPNDEPASVLLARVREQRARQETIAKRDKQTSQIQRRSKMRKKSSSLTSQHRPLVEVLTTKGQPMPPEQLLTESGYDDDSIEDFYSALRAEITQGRIRENRLTESDVMLEAVEQ